MQFGILEINPAKNPAVLDTGTWYPQQARAMIEGLEDTYWRRLQEASERACPLPAIPEFTPRDASRAQHGGTTYFIAALPDRQHVLVGVGEADDLLAADALARVGSRDGKYIVIYSTDASVLDRLFHLVEPNLGPQPLGAVPRLGIGCRMTAAVWPGAFQAMETCGFAANAIQNSVREVNLLADLLAGRPPDSNYAFSFGTIESGYTGSSFEGLWLSGVIAALSYPARLRYGADADHIQVKRGPRGLAHAREVITAARYYTFFTLDVSDILDYQALAAGVTNSSLEKKYGLAFDVLEQLGDHVQSLKNDRRFDLELSIDEHPPEIETVDCLTSAEELAYVLSEVRRRGLPVTHVAPNFGVEKGTDYRCPDGLTGLEQRIRALAPVADEYGVMLDFHSGDDLSAVTRRVIQRATQGRLHFKVSPMVQLLVAEVLSEYEPSLFVRWWDDAVAYARHEAAAGSSLAVDCLREWAEATDPAPSIHHNLFHHYGFRYVGQRDAQGQFCHRETFYDLPSEFYDACQARLADYLCMLARELF